MCRKEALAVKQKIYGAEHPLVADMFLQMGDAAMREGDQRSAETYLNPALAIEEKSGDLFMAQETRLRLAELYEQQGRRAEAESMRKRIGRAPSEDTEVVSVDESGGTNSGPQSSPAEKPPPPPAAGSPKSPSKAAPAAPRPSTPAAPAVPPPPPPIPASTPGGDAGKPPPPPTDLGELDP
jgi:hypothetical protein